MHLTAFYHLQLIHFIQLHTQLILGQKRILFDEASDLFEPIESELSLRVLGLLAVSIISLDPFIEVRVIHPFCIELMDGRMAELEHLPDVPKHDLFSSVVRIGLIGIVIGELSGNKFKLLL